MKTIILAAWKWTRLMPLTENKPKPMVKIVNKPILAHILDSIENFTNDVVIITKYKEEQIKNYFWKKYKNINISYKTQSDSKWTASALWGLDFDEDFIVLNWDTIYSSSDLEKLYKLEGYGCLVKEVEEPQNYGIFEQDEEGFAVSVVEKPQEYIWNLANMWVYKFPKEFLKIGENVQVSPRGEYELPDAINTLLETTKYKLIKQEKDFIDVGYPKHILQANKYLLEKMWEKNLIWEDTFVWNPVKLGNNVVIWKNCKMIWDIELENIQICDNVVLDKDWVYKNKIIYENGVVDID